MRRPLYETEADRKAERAVVDLICDRYSCDAVKLHRHEGVDFGLERNGRRVAWVEVKCRNLPIERHRTFIVSASKYREMVLIDHAHGLPVFLAVGWTNAVGILKVPFDHKLKNGGNKQRNDGMGDIETMIEVEISLFTILGTKA